MSISLADILEISAQMSAALKANLAEVSARGADEAFIAVGQTQIEALKVLKSEQELLQANLKRKTNEIEAELAALVKWEQEARAIVELTYREQKEKWIEFGITAKR